MNVQVIGRLGMDAEIKEAKNGSKYVSLRLATDEYRNGKNETLWINLYDYSERGLKMAQYWKKGTLLNVCGTLSVSTYQSKQTGQWMPSCDIRAYSIEFINGGSNSSGTTQSTTEVTETKPTTVIESSVGTFTKPTETPSFTTTATDSSDDLPF